MIILGIDTSCDDTGVGIVEDGSKILANIIASQHGFHVNYGGIVPSIAARRHSQVIHRILDLALKEADLAYEDIDAIAVSSDQGLGPALAIGVATAKTLSLILGVPLIAVHHVEGHIYSNLMGIEDGPEFPFLCLTVAGGHTMILAARELGTYELLGSCRDDSAGEAYDKVARRLGLGYPGGPIIDKLAQQGNPRAFSFPRPMITSRDMDFSFSGLKSAVNRLVDDLERDGASVPINDIAASFQQSVIDVLIAKTVRAIEGSGINRLAVAGGVAANSLLKSQLAAVCEARGVQLYFPPKNLCVDNGAMIAGLGYHLFQKGERADTSLDYRPNAPLGALEVKYKHHTKYRARPAVGASQ